MEKIRNIQEFSKKSGIRVGTIKYWNSNDKGPKFHVTRVVREIYPEEEWYSVFEKILSREITMKEMLCDKSCYNISKRTGVPTSTLEYWKNGKTEENINDVKYLYYTSLNQVELNEKMLSI